MASDVDPVVQEPRETHDVATKRLFIPKDGDFMWPSRWWFASSAFPMIAGTLGPVASAFSILALSRPWRQHRPPGTSIDGAPFIGDPVWLIAVNAVQLGMALTSNVFLLLNMARRVRFVVAQPVTIVGWFASSFCLVGLSATASGPLLDATDYPADEIMWSQAFYYGIFAALLYFLVAALMCITVHGAATNNYPKDFNLTTSQRTLMLQSILILLYLLLGALMFSQLEDWSYLDGVYWATVTLFTIGFGDFIPTRSVSRGLLIPYALVGIISVGLVIGSIRSLVLERGQSRIDSRVLEKKRRRMLRTLLKNGQDEILKPITESELGLYPTDSPVTTNAEPALAKEAPAPGHVLSTAPITELQRRKAEFDLMRSIQEQASAQHRWMGMATSFSLWLILWLVGAKIFQETEHASQNWTYFDGFYFTFVTLTTLGYGDRTPKSNAGKAFFVFWCLMALPTMTIMISNASDTVVRVVRDVTISVGNITILPGERSFRAEVKWFISRATFGALWSDCYDQTYLYDQDHDNSPIGGYTDCKLPVPPHSTLDAEHAILQQATGDSGAQAHAHLRPRSVVAARMRNSFSTLRHPTTPLPRGKYLHFILSSEISSVAQHAQAKREKHYTYEEWTWYLKLLGEDESDARTHAVARKHAPITKEAPGGNQAVKKEHDGHGYGSSSGRRQRRRHRKRHNDDDMPPEDWSGWSWVGINSPLLSNKSESQWILENLTERLRRELYQELVQREEGRDGTR
ncbi:hypothetical protein Cpir12675_000785 [Ceratocystis pirilliformis]|uniref:Potassium channel domain-containing protein n=1 Tax=Ceratocystis pirilliformis TaxID=259994 RepID=A0ABR3ZJB7_9PEZI